MGKAETGGTLELPLESEQGARKADGRCVQALRDEQVRLCVSLALSEVPCTTPSTMFEPYPILCPHSSEKQGEKISELGQEDREWVEINISCCLWDREGSAN